MNNKFINALPIIAIAGLIIWSFTHRDNRNAEVSSLPPRPSETNSERCEIVRNSVHDGDTFRAKCNGKELKIRLCGVDAPELKQPLGVESRDYLQALFMKANDRAIVIKMDSDRYGRTVAEVLIELPGGEQSIQEEMLKSGFVYHYKQYSGNCLNRDVFDTAEEIGRAQQLGVWKLPNGGQRPWDYRKTKRD
jgi:endonuclease YncB( thermonuclease family)